MMTKDVKMTKLYEEIIKDTIVDNIVKFKPELKPIFKNAPVEKQRELILNFLEENNDEHRLLCQEIKRIVKANKTGDTDHIAGIVQMLRKYVKVSEVEVKTMGEIMTPIELVEEMLDTLNGTDVWTNPNLKWLDPCNGVGTFLSVVVKRLMKGLETFEPVAELRYKHIMENMIFACELQAKNMFLYMYAFDPKDEFALNICNGSFLVEKDFDKMKQYWGVDKFDIIVMNPPYQELKEGNTKSQTLWDKFVIKTINNLVEGGYLVAVHPERWRNVGKEFEKVRNLLKSKQMLSLEIHDYADGLKTFKVKTTYDFYCLHNVPNTMFTQIKCENKIIKEKDGELKNVGGKIERVDLSKIEFIPNGMYKEFEKLLAKKGEEKVEMIVDSSYHTQRTEQMSKTQTEIFKYPCVYTTLSTDVVNFWYSNTNQKGHFGISKVIWSNGTASKPIVDENGDYGLTQFAYAIIDEPKNLSFIQKAMLSPKFIKLMNFRDGNGGKFGHRYDKNTIALFRKDFWKEFLG
jgi:hypothetical protein